MEDNQYGDFDLELWPWPLKSDIGADAEHQGQISRKPDLCFSRNHFRHRVNERINQPTNKHHRSQYLLAEVLITLKQSTSVSRSYCRYHSVPRWTSTERRPSDRQRSLTAWTSACPHDRCISAQQSVCTSIFVQSFPRTAQKYNQLSRSVSHPAAFKNTLNTFLDRKRVSKRYERSSSSCYQIFHFFSLRLCRFSTDRNETFYTYKWQ